MEMKVNYEYPMFADYVEPKGALAIQKESHACFYYLVLAMKARGLAGNIENQIIVYKVGELAPEWRESRDEEIARSVAILYGLESPEAFLKDEWKRRAWAQAIGLGFDGQVATQVLRVRPGVARIH